MMMRYCANEKGFGLFAVLLVFFGLAAGVAGAGFLLSKKMVLFNEHQAIGRMEIIRDATKNYFLNHEVLPGVPDAAISVPVEASELNLDQKHRLDPWGRKLEYYTATSIEGVMIEGRPTAGYILSPGINQKYESSLTGNPPLVTLNRGGDDIAVVINVRSEATCIATRELKELQDKVLSHCFSRISTDEGNTNENFDIADEAPAVLTGAVGFLRFVGLSEDRYGIDPWGREYLWGCLEGSGCAADVVTTDPRYHRFFSRGPDGISLTDDDIIPGGPTLGTGFKPHAHGSPSATQANFCENHLPIADNATYPATPGVPLAITLTYSDDDDDDVIYEIMSQPTHGTLTGTPPNLTYESGGTETDSFTWRCCDLARWSNTATITITSGSAPVAFDQYIEVPQSKSTGYRHIEGSLDGQDPDGDPLTYTLDEIPDSGHLFEFDPSTGYIRYGVGHTVEVLELKWHCNDGTSDSNIATVTINVVEKTTQCDSTPRYGDKDGQSPLKGLGRALLPFFMAVLAIALWSWWRRRANRKDAAG